MKVVLAMIGLVTGAAATPTTARDEPTSAAYLRIIESNPAAAVQLFEAQRAARPATPELMLNLAAAYLQAGRQEEARALYLKTLALPAVGMDTASGRLSSSHEVAERGLGMLSRVIAQR